MSSSIVTRIARAATATNGKNRTLQYALSVVEKRAFVTETHPLFEKHTIKVPTMGDSITEGTIVEWVASVGQMVKEDDVVALVETDKVTVDIKAEVAGVVTQQYGAVDDTVEVGADLYEIDTEAEATVTASDDAAAAAAAPAPAAEEKPAEKEPAPKAEPAVAAAKPDKQTGRTPSIKFLGKEGWARALSGSSSSSSSAEKPVVYAIPPNYGRPEFTDDEMEALVMGGANLVPDVKNYSSGAEFGY